jgi:archaeosine synthase beta-subunit
MSGLLPSVYPAMAGKRDAWILSRRPARENRDPFIPYEFFVEDECADGGLVEAVATVFLTNRECPFRCLMCDLWRNTLTETVPVGAIPAQIDRALLHLPPARQLKLYNSGSFFDPQAIPPDDYGAIAQRANRFARLIVENHPALIGDACLRFRDLLSGKLEVAMGLETVHPEAAARLNKRMTLDQFSSAANFLRRNGIDLRVFILVQPPFIPAAEALDWAERSLDFAMEHGATAAVLIPTRAGNGAMEALIANGEFAPPALHTLEFAMEYGLRLKAGRVFADLWGLRESCADCHAQRAGRLRAMNLQQTLLDRIPCASCGGLRFRRQPDGDDCSSAWAFSRSARAGGTSAHGHR